MADRKRNLSTIPSVNSRMSQTRAIETKPVETMPIETKPRRRRRWPYVLGGLVVLIGALIFAFQWDWLIPFVEPRASAALGRPVRMAHLHVKLGWTTHIVVDGVEIGNPAGWPGGGNFATAEHLVVDVDADKLIHGRHIVLPAIVLERPAVDAQQLPDGSANWKFATGSSAPSSGSGDEGPQIGKLTIDDGSVHVRSAPLNADFNVGVSTRTQPDGKDQIVASAKGTYAKQPISAEFVGGALLSLRDAADPYPVSLRLTNGPTTASATGSVNDPLAFKGVDVKLELAGPDMALLLPLTGVAIPKTPPYRITGKLDYSDGVVQFNDFAGRVGSSDLEGSLGVDTKPQRPVVTADLRSKMVDLRDLGGFIGAEPGDPGKGTKKPAAAASSGRLLPSDKLSLPRLNVADVHLKYQARRIEGRKQPLDNMTAAMDIVNGDVSLHPLSFGIGRGKIASQIQLAQRGNSLAAKADIDFQRVDVSKLMTATGVGEGAGAIGGRAKIEGTGDSVAQILAGGNGELKLYMGAGGNLSALLVDLSGLQFGDALLSALGVPTRTRIQCLITDFVLTGGRAQSRLTMLDTDEARIGLVGDVNMKSEALNLQLRTEAKHFSVGSLPAAIGIDGTMGKPGISPNLGEAGARAAAAAGLGVVLTPLAALLPTIQMGTGEDGACSSLMREVQTPPRVPEPAKPPARRRK